jgi:hypothetical protein
MYQTRMHTNSSSSWSDTNANKAKSLLFKFLNISNVRWNFDVRNLRNGTVTEEPNVEGVLNVLLNAT